MIEHDWTIDIFMEHEVCCIKLGSHHAAATCLTIFLTNLNKRTCLRTKQWITMICSWLFMASWTEQKHMHSPSVHTHTRMHTSMALHFPIWKCQDKSEPRRTIEHSICTPGAAGGCLSPAWRTHGNRGDNRGESMRIPNFRWENHGKPIQKYINTVIICYNYTVGPCFDPRWPKYLETWWNMR